MLLRKIIIYLLFYISITLSSITSASQTLEGAGNNAIQGNSNTSTTHTIINHYNSSGGDSYVLHPSSQINLAVPWNTPYLPGHFVNRNELRKRILEKLEDNNKTLHQAILVGLHGLGGIGKTYLALNMIYNPVKDYSFRGWFTANDESKLKAEYFKLGEELGLLTDDMREEQKVSLVKNWLNNQDKLLLVFDNVPNIEVVEKYLPQKGDIIVTSLNYKIPSTIEVDVMNEDETIKLLKNILPKNSNFKEYEYAALAKKLGYLPLALAQAGAYIEQNKITIDKYLKLYDKEQNVLLSSSIMPIGDKHLPIYITWYITLTEIRKQDKTDKAIELLELMAFCDFVDIPKIFLIKYLYDTVDSKAEVNFHKVITFLRRYSLIKVSSDTITIHHLVQDLVKESLNSFKRSLVLQKALETIKVIYPLNDKKANDYEIIKLLLPQMENLLIYTKTYLHNTNNVLLLIYIADGCWKRGDYNKAKTLLEESLNIQEGYYGTRKHFEIAITLNRLGRVYSNLGFYHKAAKLLEESLKIQDNYYNFNNHIEIAKTLSRLGKAYLNLGDYKVAEKLLEQALSIQTNYCSTGNSIERAKAMSRLGRVYLGLAEYRKAKNLLEEALRIQKNYYSSDHIEIGMTLSRLGRIHANLGNYHKAKELLENGLKIQEKFLGKREHKDIAVTLSRLGGVYLNLGNYHKAKELLENSLKIQEDYYNTSNHIEITFTLSRLGRLYSSLEDHRKAQTLLEKALEIQKAYYGTSNHVEIAKTLSRLGGVCLHLEHYNKAQSLLEKALEIQEKYYYTSNNVERAKTLNRLGRLYFSLGDRHKAQSLLEKALEIQKTYYGDDNHFDLAKSLFYLSKLEANFNPKRALLLIEQVENILTNYPSLYPEHNYIKKVKTQKEKILNLLSDNIKKKDA